MQRGMVEAVINLVSYRFLTDLEVFAFQDSNIKISFEKVVKFIKCTY